jgi:uncharacterized protein (TIGR02271 family)
MHTHGQGDYKETKMTDHQYGEEVRIVDREGVLIGTLLAAEEEGQTSSALLVRTGDGREVSIPYDQVDRSVSTAEEIVVDLEAASVDVSPEAARISESYANISLVEEELDVSTRWAEQGRVVIRKRVETVPQERTIELVQEGVEVVRTPVNEVVDELPQVRTEGETTIIPVVEEVLVVEKRYRLIEEVRVTSTRSTEQHTIREDLRREVVDFEEVPAADRDSER